MRLALDLVVLLDTDPVAQRVGPLAAPDAIAPDQVLVIPFPRLLAHRTLNQQGASA
jgi:hypothetical protein